MSIAEEQTIEVVEAPEADDPYIVVMKIWARWMTLEDRQYSDGMSHPQDAKEFMRTGEAVDAMINDLPRVEWWAVRKAHGLARVWNFPNADLADTLVAAERKLKKKMLGNVDTRRYFPLGYTC